MIDFPLISVFLLIIVKNTIPIINPKIIRVNEVIENVLQYPVHALFLYHVIDLK